MKRWSHRVPLWVYLLIGAGIMLLAALIEHGMGRLLICKCGVVRLWADAGGSENSQQLFDWYSFSHVIHGFCLYAFFHLVSRGKWALGLCLVLAIALEASWEVLENSPVIIDRYRQTMSQDYYGDTVLNSMSDILCAIFGFVLAGYLPVWMTLVLIVVLEVGVGFVIRDGLVLNIIMLIHPFQAIKQWQMGR